jgi:hypothetical protein
MRGRRAAVSDQAERRHAEGVNLLAALSIEHYGDADLDADLAIVTPFLAAAEQRGAELALEQARREVERHCPLGAREVILDRLTPSRSPEEK